MDIKKIIKEEVDDFKWIKDTEPTLKRYRIVYNTEAIIQAYTFEQAKNIYEGLDLYNLDKEILKNRGEPGLTHAEWRDDEYWQKVNEWGNVESIEPEEDEY